MWEFGPPEKMDGNWPYSNYSGMEDNYSEYHEEELVYLCEQEYRGSASSATAACYAVIFCLSLTGNLLVLCAIAKCEDLKNVTNLFVLNLAVSDLVFSVSLPFWITDHLYQWVFGDVLCKLVSGLYFICIYSSLMFLVAMTIDRYIVIVHIRLAMDPKRLQCSWVVCTVIWVVSIAASLREMTVSRISPEYDCEREDHDSQEIYINYYLHICLLFLAPLAVIVFCYSRILKTVISSRTKKKHRTVALIFVIVLTFFVCRAPYNVMILFMPGSHKRDCDTQRRQYVAFVAVRILAYSHCCLNPLLYYTFREKCRDHIRRLFCSVPPRGRYYSAKYNAAQGMAVNNRTTENN